MVEPSLTTTGAGRRLISPLRVASLESTVRRMATRRPGAGPATGRWMSSKSGLPVLLHWQNFTVSRT